MKENFPAYYPYDQQTYEFILNESAIVVDTNVLIALVEEFDKEIQETIFNLLHEIRNRIWIPHRVMEEFHRHCRPELLRDDTQIEIWQKIIDLVTNQVGPSYKTERLIHIYQQGETRYGLNIPPGYKDRSKKETDRQYGDLIIWHQMIDYAKESKKPILFVMNDQKEDWWQKEPDGKVLGPRYELIQEMKNEADVLFWAYRTSQFTKYMSSWLKRSITPGILKQIERLEKLLDDEVALESHFHQAIRNPKVQESLLSQLVEIARKESREEHHKIRTVQLLLNERNLPPEVLTNILSYLHTEAFEQFVVESLITGIDRDRLMSSVIPLLEKVLNGKTIQKIWKEYLQQQLSLSLPDLDIRNQVEVVLKVILESLEFKEEWRKIFESSFDNETGKRFGELFVQLATLPKGTDITKWKPLDKPKKYILES